MHFIKQKKTSILLKKGRTLMNIKNLKRLVKNLAFADEKSKFTTTELLSLFPELVSLSREANKKTQSLFRILKLPEGETETPFYLESTSRSISSCFHIATCMPSLIYGTDKMISLNMHLYLFEVPTDHIYIDFDVIMPILEKRLSKVLNHRVSDKYDDLISIDKILTTYKKNNEKELIVDLENLDYKKVELKLPFRELPAYIIFKSFETDNINCSYLNEAQDYFNEVLPVMPNDYRSNMEKWMVKHDF